MKGSKAMLALATMAMMADSSMHEVSGKKRKTTSTHEPYKRKKCKSCVHLRNKCEFNYRAKPKSKACSKYKPSNR